MGRGGIDQRFELCLGKRAVLAQAAGGKGGSSAEAAPLRDELSSDVLVERPRSPDVVEIFYAVAQELRFPDPLAPNYAAGHDTS